MLVAVCSARGSPGATTGLLALAATWPDGRRLRVVEADPDGGVLAARYGLAADPSLTTVAAARGDITAALAAGCQRLPGGLETVVAPAAGGEAARAVALTAGRLARWPAEAAGDVLVDVGRLRADSPAGPVVAAADVLLVVLRGCLEQVAATAGLLEALPAAARPRLLVVGVGVWEADELEDGLEVGLAGWLPDDPAAAAVLAGRRTMAARTLARTGLLRAAGQVTGRLTARPQEATTGRSDGDDNGGGGGGFAGTAAARVATFAARRHDG